MGISARKLAESLALRLNAVVPTSFRLSADQGQLHVYIEGERYVTLGSLEIAEDETRELRERLRTAVYGVLSAVQDDVSEHLRTPWPTADGRAMAEPDMRIDAELLHLWYGVDERAPIVGIPPIRLAELVDADDQ